ncbi:MAG: DUF2798 domain-containing protein, partial [Candidatus Dadabacteria bacterium]|nr:DUF2798 domain-containing protein [Candidatus Dadabacteria bacterium]
MKFNVEIKKRVVFSLIMGLITTGIISFTIMAIHYEFNNVFLLHWNEAWFIAYIIVIPAILLIAPPLQ